MGQFKKQLYFKREIEYKVITETEKGQSKKSYTLNGNGPV